MAAKLRWEESLSEPDQATLEGSRERAFSPLGRRRGDLESVRRRLYQVMWDDVGILRTADGLTRARHELNNLATSIANMGVADTEKRYNLTWMDRLNLENLVLVSRSICAAAQARNDSRGAHYREDFPETSALATSRYTVVRMEGENFDVTTEPVDFSRVKPGQSLLHQAAE
jgi:fumarate reductase flavoprotein subunit